MNQKIRINQKRLQRRLEEMAMFGKTAAGGVSRIALTEEDKLGRETLITWLKEEQCEVHIDAMGNIFGVYPGKNRALAPVLTGSHNDTQPKGGRFDGTLGVIAGVEVISTLRENSIKLERDVILANWTNEEGTRFTPGCTGSGVWSGKLSQEEMYLLKDQEGKTFGEELEKIGFKGSAQYPPLPLHAAFELHVEQGPVLDSSDVTIGIPEGIVSPRWYDVDIYGEANHAGSTPMLCRQDALYAFSKIHQRIRDLAVEAGEVVATVGQITASPNSRNVIASHVHFTIDVRGWDVAKTDNVCAGIEEAIATIASADQCQVEIEHTWREDRADFDQALLKQIEESANQLGLTSMRMYSGASHDMIYINQVARGAMIFVPSVGGKSHTEIEETSYADCGAGADVLLQCIMKSANDL
ncbi:Zn-dependent hydrolase [Desulfosediminicola flagellatus]|uniref:Zn-dependent hydrolase n=1 Tax=Desulfosediminicola flagellatus TaxID=2569541 RepID=UPI0010AB61E8|nr:Zn-dependent hydrolase [Desulfosediminicola flagellatus]